MPPLDPFERFLLGIPPNGELAQLVGGVFDGDQGVISKVVPRVWAWACGEPRSVCEAGNGIHWLMSLDDVPPEFEGKTVRYDLDEDGSPDERGVYFYVHPEMTDPRAVTKREDMVTA